MVDRMALPTWHKPHLVQRCLWSTLTSRRVGLGESHATVAVRRQKQHINIFNKKLFAPTQNTPLGPQEKVDAPHFLGKDTEKETHINFIGGIVRSKGGPERDILGHKKSSFLLFPALTIAAPVLLTLGI